MDDLNLKSRIYLGTMLVGLFAGASFTLTAQATFEEDCLEHAYRVEDAKKELKDFEKLVIQPLKNEREKLVKQRKYKIERPQKLVAAMKTIEKDNRNRETAIEQEQIGIRTDQALANKLDEEAAQLEAQGQLKKAAEKRKAAQELRSRITKRETNIILLKSKIAQTKAISEQYQEELNEITSTPPSVDELNAKITEVNNQLADEAELRKEKERNVDYAERVRGLCHRYNNLEQDYLELKARCP